MYWSRILLVLVQARRYGRPTFLLNIYICPHKKYTENKMYIMAKLLYIWEREIYL